MNRRPLKSRLVSLVAIAMLVATMGGCSIGSHLNPTFHLSLQEARGALTLMADEPKSLDRPVVVLGGIHDPGIVAASLARAVRRITTDEEKVISVAFFGANTFDDCRDRLIRVIDERFGKGENGETIEVDVIGFSMGGLVARHAARPREGDGRRINVARLFTISTPHRGARLASIPTLDDRAIDMRIGSSFLRELNLEQADPSFELFCYTRLDDAIVGAANTAPPGHAVWWVPNLPFDFSHMGASEDPRIQADILRRLRDEPPFSSEPPAPLPGQKPPTRVVRGGDPGASE